jgi:putative ABC transport system permease protein
MPGDLKFALRSFRKSPGFVALSVLVLALGIGANTAIFSVVDAVLLRGLPFRDADRMVMIWEKNPQLNDFLAERFPVALHNFLSWKQLSHSFSAMTVLGVDSMVVLKGDKPERIQAMSASAGAFDFFGVRPALGRTFRADETEPGKNHVVMLSHALFVRRFGGDPKVLGQTIDLEDGRYTIVGIWPASFHMSGVWQGFDQLNPDLWLPLDTRADQPKERLWWRSLFVYARLRPGVSVAQARAEMAAIGQRLQRDDPENNNGMGVSVFPVSEEDVGADTRLYILLLQGAVGFVLLIACANVANILLARSIARRNEIAVRLALGATRLRIVRQMLSESLLLSFAGGAAGLLLAWWGIKWLMLLAPKDAPHMHELTLDAATLWFTLAAVVVTGFIFGLAPAFDAARRNVNEALNQGGRSGTSALSARLRGFLVSGEVALALILFVGAGLLVRTVHAMLTADQGFRREGLLSVQLRLSPDRYKSDEKAVAFAHQILDRVSALPGVVSASVTSGLPMQRLSIDSYSLDGTAPPPAPQPLADIRAVSESYFRTMSIPMIRGRAFTRQEAEDPKSSSIIINETMAKEVWPGQDAVGKALTYNDRRRVVIGIAGDARQMGVESKISPEIYLPSYLYRGLTVVVRAAGNPSALAAPIAREVLAIDKDQPISDTKTMDQVVLESIAEKRFVMLLLGAFAALALVLAAAGIYGVLAYSVSQRTREIGIRMALGADPRAILKLIVVEGLTLSGIGVAIGAAGAFALTRLMRGLIYGVSPSDPGTFLAGAAAVLCASVLASWIPAARAAKLAPLEALRHD